MEQFLTDAKDYFDIAAYIVAASSIVANKTSTDKDDKAIGFLSKIINLFAANLFRVKK